MRAKDHQPLPHPSMTFAGRHTKDELADFAVALRAENRRLREALHNVLMAFDQGPDSEAWMRARLEGAIDPLDSTGEEEDHAAAKIKNRALGDGYAALASHGKD